MLALRSSSTAVRFAVGTTAHQHRRDVCVPRLLSGTRKGHFPARSLLTALPSDPRELRPLLHAEVDKLGDEKLRLLHRVALELELEEVTERLNQGFDEDRMTGKLERLPQIIQTARAALRARAAS